VRIDHPHTINDNAILQRVLTRIDGVGQVEEVTSIRERARGKNVELLITLMRKGGGNVSYKTVWTGRIGR
jgi:hypothetical protein